MSNPTELPNEFNAAYMAHYIQPPEDNEPHAERCRTWWNKGIAAARRAQPEDEAPLRKCSKFGHRCNCAVDCDPEKPHPSIAATLPPLCGAQHAESGKDSAPTDQMRLDWLIENDAMVYRGDRFLVAQPNRPGIEGWGFGETPRAAIDAAIAHRGDQLDGGQEGSAT